MVPRLSGWGGWSLHRPAQAHRQALPPWAQGEEGKQGSCEALTGPECAGVRGEVVASAVPTGLGKPWLPRIQVREDLGLLPVHVHKPPSWGWGQGTPCIMARGDTGLAQLPSLTPRTAGAARASHTLWALDRSGQEGRWSRGEPVRQAASGSGADGGQRWQNQAA